MQSNTRTIPDVRLNYSEAEETFQLMVESVTDCSIVMLDRDGLIRTWNSGACLLYTSDAADDYSV